MIDNVTLVKECRPPLKFFKTKWKPVEYNGVLFYPKYKNGDLIRFDGKLRNLLLCYYPEKVYLMNSLHKYWHGNNYGDFYLAEVKDAIQCINDQTSINWNDAITKKIEYGCNLPNINTQATVGSMLSYKGKGFLPTSKNGIKYGTYCGFDDYDLKGYDKKFEVGKTDKITLRNPVFRWEISIKKMRAIKNIVPDPLTVGELLTTKTMDALAGDAVNKYNKTARMQTFHLHKLTAHEKLVLAAMLNDYIRSDIKMHHKEAYKKYQRFFKKVISNKDICVVDNIEQLMAEKFNQLIQGLPACSIVGKRGTTVPYTNQILNYSE